MQVSSVDSNKFPPSFLWGAATAAHQVEGNNVNSDSWLVEHIPNSMYKEPSGNACDHYRVYEEDIRLLADLGFNTYRFSIEWARIEPAKGQFSSFQLEHYRRVLEVCCRYGLTPFVTLFHFTAPCWFAFQGGWESFEAPHLFSRYSERVISYLGDLIPYCATFNEPDMPQLYEWIRAPAAGSSATLADVMVAQRSSLRRQLNASRFSTFLTCDPAETRANLLAAHTMAKTVIKSLRANVQVGFTLAVEHDEAEGITVGVEEKRRKVYDPWLVAARADDFVGIQTYTRHRISTMTLPPAIGAELTQMGYEFYPESLEFAVRYASEKSCVPVVVTENGVATEDDARRIEYILRALTALKRCIDSGIDVRGYIHWSLLDNFEWLSGFRPKFGLIAVDRVSQERHLKRSAIVLGAIARDNSL